jgi:hypothetical protein
VLIRHDVKAASFDDFSQAAQDDCVQQLSDYFAGIGVDVPANLAYVTFTPKSGAYSNGARWAACVLQSASPYTGTLTEHFAPGASPAPTGS